MHTTYSEFITHLRALSSASVIVFDGYSGLGYANPELVQGHMRQAMLKAMQAHEGPLYVVAGATADGIGSCYDVAIELRQEGFPIETVGIVSEQATVEHDWGCALPASQIEKLDHLMLIADPEGTWQVLNGQGQSLMVDIGLATPHPTHFCFYGGGAVAHSELVELEQRLMPSVRVRVTIHHGVGDFSPIERKAQQKYAQRMEQMLGKGASLNDAQKAAARDVDGTHEFLEGLHSTPQRRSNP